MEKSTEIRIVYVSAPSYEIAGQIARILVTEKIAACCSIIQNAVSVYGWQGSIQERHEYLLMIKTATYKLDELEDRVRELSKDECPEILALSVESSSPDYHSWVQQSLSD